MNPKSTLSFVVLGMLLCAGLAGCSGGDSTTSNEDVASAAKEMGDKGKGGPSGPPLQAFGGKPGGAMKPHAASNGK